MGVLVEKYTCSPMEVYLSMPDRIPVCVYTPVQTVALLHREVRRRDKKREGRYGSRAGTFMLLCVFSNSREEDPLRSSSSTRHEQRPRGARATDKPILYVTRVVSRPPRVFCVLLSGN